MSNLHESIPAATQYIGRYGWGTQGRMLGISRMVQDTDIGLLKKGKFVASTRPRGVLSGFLAIVPSLRAAVYLPPVAGKISPKILRLRLADEILEKGAVLSCYWDGNELVLEDVLVWKGTAVWQTLGFQERWSQCMQSFCSGWTPDTMVQGFPIRLTEYMSLEQIQKPQEREVIEFVPEVANTKRIIWVPSEETETNSCLEHWVRRESAIGPDIFSVWTAEAERLGIAYIRALATSRALRLHPANEFRVKTSWNKMFERYEILEILPPLPSRSS